MKSKLKINLKLKLKLKNIITLDKNKLMKNANEQIHINYINGNKILKDRLNDYIKKNNITNKNLKKDLIKLCQKFDIYVPCNLTKKILIELLEIPEESIKKTRHITSRISTQQTAAMCDYIKIRLDPTQPIFTKEDEEKKQEIWGYEKGYSPFSGKNKEATDHIYGLREGITNYDVCGSDTEWNKIECTSEENSGSKFWKKIPNSIKNIVYDEFTQEEIEKFDENTKNKYYKLKKWIEYCDERGAKLFYSNVKEIDLKIKKHLQAQADETNNFIDNLE